MDSKPTEERVYVHKGVISKISGRSVFVSLDKNLHCDSCHAKGACGISDSKAKEIEIVNSGGHYKLYEPVEVVLKKHAGHKAVFWAYVFPFILMLLTLLTASLLFSEWIAGLLSLLVLVPYYLLIHGLKNYFRKTLDISIQSI